MARRITQFTTDSDEGGSSTMKVMADSSTPGYVIVTLQDAKYEVTKWTLDEDEIPELITVLQSALQTK